MEVVSLETSEMELFVDFKLPAEQNECGQVYSRPENWYAWARAQNIPKQQFFVAKDTKSQWRGAVHWEPMGSHDAKIFPLLRGTDLGDAKRVELSCKLLGKALHEILKKPEIEQVGTQPFSGQIDDAYRIALFRAGFQFLGTRVEFKTPVSQVPEEVSNTIEWRPVSSEAELPLAATMLREACFGDSHGLDARENPMGYISEALSEGDLTSDLTGIHLGFINNVPAAYVHVQINPKTGWSRITYMGILKEFRQKGLGEHVHRHAFSVIREHGGTLYHGGTSSENKSMIRLFEKNNCIKYSEVQEWRLDVKKLRENLSICALNTPRLRLEPM